MARSARRREVSDGRVSLQALRTLADSHLSAILQRLPSDRLGRFILFIEVVRAMDYWSITAYPDSLKNAQTEQSLDLMYWGWNRAVAELFEPLDQPGAFPMMESTRESRGLAAGLMQEFGKVSLARRLADMGERGIMEIARDGDDFRMRMTEDARAQLADFAESGRLKAAEARLPSSSAGWTMASMRNAMRFPDMPGNYVALANAPVRRVGSGPTSRSSSSRLCGHGTLSMG